MKANDFKKVRRIRRRLSVRRRLGASTDRPRLCVQRSLKHTYAQVVDGAGRTLCGTGTSAKKVGSELAGKTKTEKAAFVGREIARLAREKGVEAVVFDRGHCKYHGRVKALADAAREGGLQF
jgi:large subunit ribosomal protein L18